MLAGVLDRVLEELSQLSPWLLHLVVAGLAFSETALFLDLLVPGEVGMVLAGAAARRADIGVVGLIAAGSLGATLGDSCSYAFGRWVGHRRLERWPALDRRLRSGVERAEQSFSRRGGAAVFFGRWVGALRAVVPFVAGAGRMPYGRFLAWNVLASVGWVSTVVLLGWTFGETVASTVDWVGEVVSVVVVAALVTWVVVRRRRGVRRAETGPSPLGSSAPSRHARSRAFDRRERG